MTKLEQEANKFIQAHKNSVLYGTLDEFEEIYNLPALAKFKETNIKSDINRVVCYLEKDEMKYREVYNKAWELIEPYLNDNISYAIDDIETEPTLFGKIISSIFNIEE